MNIMNVEHKDKTYKLKDDVTIEEMFTLSKSEKEYPLLEQIALYSDDPKFTYEEVLKLPSKLVMKLKDAIEEAGE